MKNASELRAEAAKCRALAKQVRDRMTANNLLALAGDYEAQAQALETRPEGATPLPRPQ